MRCKLLLVYVLVVFCALSVAQRRGYRKKVKNINVAVATSDYLYTGSTVLFSCNAEGAFCGSIDRELDPSGIVQGNIQIGFEFYPRGDFSLPPLETIVAAEGGPGFATTESRSGYLALLAPLRDRHDILLVDNRGTGLSKALNCPLLQGEPNPRPSGIGSCGKQLSDAAYLYGSGLAADDLAAVLDVLEIATIDLYGDSYGTYFSQAFAARHSERLRSMVLDSAYPVVGQSPWYPEIAPTARFAFNAACRRSPACSSLTTLSIHRIEQLIESLRARPYSGDAHDGDGVLHYTRADPITVGYLMVSNLTQSVVYRELDAAARAYLDQSDAAPLLRLVAENNTSSQSGGAAYPSNVYSQAIFVSVSCSDYPQIYDMHLGGSTRKLQRDQAIAKQKQIYPYIYSPLTIDEFDKIPLDTSVLDLCLSWPSPVVTAYPPGYPVSPSTHFTKAPVLVLSGDMDSLTPALQGKHAAELFENGRHVIVQNSFHVTAVGDQDNCASLLVLHFIRDLNPGDTSCVDRIAEVHLVPKFASDVAEVEPATPALGNRGTDADLRIAAAATQTVGDALARWAVNQTGDGVGLRGGHFHYSSSGNVTYYNLDKLKWVKDLAVSGEMSWTFDYPGNVKTWITLSGITGEEGELSITWDSRVPLANAIITGRIDGRRIVATMYAP